MPFPTDSFVVHGGCGCTAVRYRMSVPEFDQRARYPYHTPGVDIGDIRLPMSVICHCNGCRRATTSLGAPGMTSNMSVLELSILPDTIKPSYSKPAADGDRPPYVPATTILDAEDRATAIDGLWLTHYEPSPKINRWFCGRCGTHVFAAPDKTLERPGWPRMVNVLTGSVDRDLLANEWFRPQHINCVALGIPWVREYVKVGMKDVPEHPLFLIDGLMTDNFKPMVEHMHSMGMDYNVTIWE
jgi:hypothetical protein